VTAGSGPTYTVTGSDPLYATTWNDPTGAAPARVQVVRHSHRDPLTRQKIHGLTVKEDILSTTYVLQDTVRLRTIGWQPYSLAFTALWFAISWLLHHVNLALVNAFV
jgi:hypothetical protein